MTDATTTISLAPFVEALLPTLVVIASAISTAAVTYLVDLVRKWGLQISQANEAKLVKEVSTQAGLAIAASATNLAGESIDAHSPAVVKAASYITNNLQALMKSTGVTPDNVAHLVAGEIGKLQAATPTVVAALPAPPASAPLK